ncbi:hypothetical protein [Paenibacillus sp. sgz500992]|uniref:hypothetical protein n=1 Tax=Paenibacillus sp. sgz500992 TaxID=3242476 RepID=UPI0036D3C282
MWDPATKLIKFVPETPFSDPSYPLPHFYELFALQADEQDRAFWKNAAPEAEPICKRLAIRKPAFPPNILLLLLDIQQFPQPRYTNRL